MKIIVMIILFALVNIVLFGSINYLFFEAFAIKGHVFTVKVHTNIRN